MRRSTVAALSLCLAPLTLLALVAAGPVIEGQNGLSGLPTPRFVSVAAGEANMRTGPGDRYPIKWIYRRAGLPVEVLKEFDVWRLVRDPGGEIGWVNGNLLTGERTAYITRSVRTLYARPDIAAPPVWRAEPGVVAKIVLCEQAWCQLRADGRSGYILRNQIWGVYPRESVGE